MSCLRGPSSPGHARTRFPGGFSLSANVTAPPQLVVPRRGVKLCAGRSRSSPTYERTRETGGRPSAARGPVPAAAGCPQEAARFTEIDGATLGALVSVQLFTAVIPLIIIGFDYFSGFAENASPGTLFIREVALGYPLTGRVRAAFGDSSAFRSSWTFIGVAGFLVWGIPMSSTIAGIFAKAWRREQFGPTAVAGRHVVGPVPDDDHPS
jgi:hypothetical protein